MSNLTNIARQAAAAEHGRRHYKRYMMGETIKGYTVPAAVIAVVALILLGRAPAAHAWALWGDAVLKALIIVGIAAALLVLARVSFRSGRGYRNRW